MDTRYSDEQLELRSATASLVAHLGPRTVEDFDDADRRERLADAGRRAGWFELRGPGEGDNPLASGVEVAIVARDAADTPFLGPVLAIDLARQAGLEFEDARVSAVLDASLLDLASLPASGNVEAVAVDCAGSEAGLVLRQQPGDEGKASIAEVSLGVPVPATDLTRALAPVSLTAADGSEPESVGITDAMVERARALALAISVADLVGIMEGVLETTSTYTKERQQYGVAIGSFQAVQHLLAEARVLVEGASSVAQYAAWAVDALPPEDAWEAGAVAKAYSAGAARTVCETAIQVHGGIGNTWECFVHVYLRRAMLSSALLGDDAHHLSGLARRRLGYERGL